MPRGTYDLVVDYSGSRWSGGMTSYTPPPVDLPPIDGWTQGGDSKTEPPSQAAEPGTHEVAIEVGTGFVFTSNFILALILLFLPLLWFFRKHLKFERARQAESDTGPTGLAAMFEQSEDDEEEE